MRCCILNCGEIVIYRYINFLFCDHTFYLLLVSLEEGRNKILLWLFPLKYGMIAKFGKIVGMTFQILDCTLLYGLRQARPHAIVCLGIMQI